MKPKKDTSINMKIATSHLFI
ncbi:hypothetical protein, partial [Plasmodium yoelii yoelii]